MSNQTPTSTHWANIFVGLRPGYDALFHSQKTALDLIQAYVDAKGLCVSVKSTSCIYTGDSEPGVIVGLINYPRFPSSAKAIKEHAFRWPPC
jgi:hypothetical protein